MCTFLGRLMHVPLSIICVTTTMETCVHRAGSELLQALGKMTRAWSEAITVKSPKGSPVFSYPVEEHDMV